MDYLRICVNENMPLAKVLEIIEETHMQAAIVVQDNILRGTVTDGDIRRYLLKGGKLDAAIKEVMCRQPVYLLEYARQTAPECMEKNHIHMIPIVDSRMEVVDVEFDSEYGALSINVQQKLAGVPVVIMAGGEGKRLLPYTSILPKPLMPVGGRTVLEHIIGSFMKYGCEKYYLTLNYKKEVIKAYLKEVDIPCGIHYVEEDNYMGTAGSLALLKDKLRTTFIVSNCDTLLEADYNLLYEKHKKEKNKITLILLEKEYEIPYGVVNTDAKGQVMTLQEKPHLKYQLNTGVYIMEPDVLEKMKEQYIDMTELIENILKSNERIGSYVISENQWMDVGKMETLSMVNRG